MTRSRFTLSLMLPAVLSTSSPYLAKLSLARIRTVTFDADEFEIGKTVHHFTQLAVEGNFAVVNDDDAFAEFLNVRHAMARQQDGGLCVALWCLRNSRTVFCETTSRPMVGSSRTESGWCRREAINSIFHAFTEGQFTHADVEFVADVEHLGHLSDGALKTVLRDAVNLGVQLQ